MRQIKFRCWDEGAGQMVENVSIPFLKGWLGDNAACCINCVFKNTKGRLAWMQFTGLKDKNGKDIYEGDIVKVPLYGNAIIVWNESICAFQYAYDAIGKGTSIGGRVTNTLYDHDSKSKYEVIGNIHENPELIIALNKED